MGIITEGVPALIGAVVITGAHAAAHLTFGDPASFADAAVIQVGITIFIVSLITIWVIK